MRHTQNTASQTNTAQINAAQATAAQATGDARTLAQRRAGRALRALARHLGYGGRAYDLTLPAHTAADRIATLQGDCLIVTVTWPARGSAGVLVRACAGRSDRLGGQNHVFDTAFLDQPVRFATLLRERFPALRFENRTATAKVA